MKRFVVFLAAILALYVGTAFAQNVYTPIDPCNLYMHSAITIPIAISTSSPATTQLIAAPTTGKIWICAIDVQPATSSTVELNYGTGTTCGTGNANLTGALAAALSQVDAGVPPMIVPTGDALCATVTGTGGQGHVTYVVE